MAGLRKDWDSYFLDIAFKVAGRSTCPRLNVGAVVVKDRRIKGTGYNGSPSGLPHCLDEGCLMANNHCIRCLHAELNAIMECSPEERRNATIYITDQPCAECAKIIVASGIIRVVYERPYPPDYDWFDITPWIEVACLQRETANPENDRQPGE